MSETKSESVERLRKLWLDWGLKPDNATAEAQQRSLPAVEAWLATADKDPEVPCRVAQLLLLDPERPDAHRRRCWSALQRRIEQAWANVGTDLQHVLFAQALVLAAWPQVDGRWLWLASLFEGAWDLARGRPNQQEALLEWRSRACAAGDSSSIAVRVATEPGNIGSLKVPDLSSFAAVYKQVDDNKAQLPTVSAQVLQLLDLLKKGQDAALAGLTQATKETSSILGTHHGYIKSIANELDLLWWGQARYCRTLKKPFRKLQSNHDVLWWAPWEAAEVAMVLYVEPAASYLVEVLSNLGHDVTEAKPLRAWMEELHGTLVRAGELAPKPCAPLQLLVAEDPLGLPVTWVRCRAASKEAIGPGADGLCLGLDNQLDRGQWASLIFREALLDRSLAIAGET